MVNWQDPDVIVYCFFLYEQIAVFMLGFYGTQFLNTLSIDLELLTRRRAFRPVHAPYLLARYITLAALLFFVVTGRVRNRISCDPAYRIFASLGCFAASLASLLLGSRPATIFWTLKIRAPLFLLLVLGLGQLCLAILQGSTAIRATWSDEQAMCVVYQWDPRALAAFYVYTFGYDVVILLMTLYAVHGVQQQQHRKRWGLGDILCIQGIGYVVATCVANLPIAVLAFLDLNPGMGVLLSLPAMTTSVISSSLTLFSLEEFGSQDTSRSRSDRTPAGSRGVHPAAERGSGQHGIVTTHIPMTLSEIDSREIYDDDLATLTAKAQLRGDAENENESQASHIVHEHGTSLSLEDVSTAR